MKAALREHEEEGARLVAVSISKASDSQMSALYETLGVSHVHDEAAPLPPRGLRFAPELFDWAGGEDANSAAAVAKLSA
jgi:hypothetical protein